MKKILVILSLFLVSLSCFSQESVTITTYYPSPSGSYKKIEVGQTLRLIPTDPVLPCITGQLFYDDDDATDDTYEAGIYYCDATPQPVLIGPAVGGSLWTVSGSDIYYEAGNVGIGTTSSPGAKLEVAGQVKITGGNPGAGKILRSDADGLATWQPLEKVKVNIHGVIVDLGTALNILYSSDTNSEIILAKGEGATASVTCQWYTGVNRYSHADAKIAGGKLYVRAQLSGTTTCDSGWVEGTKTTCTGAVTSTATVDVNQIYTQGGSWCIGEDTWD